MKAQKNLLFPVLILALSLVPLAGSAHAEGPPAVLTVVAGDVSVIRGGQTLNGEFGAALQSGDVVKTGANAQAAVFFTTGQVIELGPNSSITVGGISDGAAGSGGEVSMTEVEPAQDLALFAQTTSSQEGLSSLPTLRAGDADDLVAVSPRQTRVGPGEVTFRWSGVEDVLEYKLVLEGPGKAAGEHRVEDNVWTLPAEMGFDYGETWKWHVVAITLDGEVESSPVTLEVADKETVGGMQGFRKQMEPLLQAKSKNQKETALYLMSSYARSAGFYEDAIDHLSELVKSHPERKELRRELGYLYQAIGRNDRAAEEYRRALEE